MGERVYSYSCENISSAYECPRKDWRFLKLGMCDGTRCSPYGYGRDRICVCVVATLVDYGWSVMVGE